MFFSRIFLKWGENILGKSLTNAPVAGTGKFGDMDLSAPFFMVSAVLYGSSATGVRPVGV
jgi:hypothetical protein